MFNCFKLIDQTKIWLTYKDFENEEITVNNEDDLAAAYKLFFMEKFIKFFVHYSGFIHDSQTVLENNLEFFQKSISIASMNSSQQDIIMNKINSIKQNLDYQNLNIDQNNKLLKESKIEESNKENNNEINKNILEENKQQKQNNLFLEEKNQKQSEKINQIDNNIFEKSIQIEQQINEVQQKGKLNQSFENIENEKQNNYLENQNLNQQENYIPWQQEILNTKQIVIKDQKLKIIFDNQIYPKEKSVNSNDNKNIPEKQEVEKQRVNESFEKIQKNIQQQNQEQKKEEILNTQPQNDIIIDQEIQNSIQNINKSTNEQILENNQQQITEQEKQIQQQVEENVNEVEDFEINQQQNIQIQEKNLNQQFSQHEENSYNLQEEEQNLNLINKNDNNEQEVSNDQKNENLLNLKNQDQQIEEKILISINQSQQNEQKIITELKNDLIVEQQIESNNLQPESDQQVTESIQLKLSIKDRTKSICESKKEQQKEEQQKSATNTENVLVEQVYIDEKDLQEVLMESFKNSPVLDLICKKIQTHILESQSCNNNNINTLTQSEQRKKIQINTDYQKLSEHFVQILQHQLNKKYFNNYEEDQNKSQNNIEEEEIKQQNKLENIKVDESIFQTIKIDHSNLQDDDDIFASEKFEKSQNKNKIIKHDFSIIQPNTTNYLGSSKNKNSQDKELLKIEEASYVESVFEIISRDDQFSDDERDNNNILQYQQYLTIKKVNSNYHKYSPQKPILQKNANSTLQEANTKQKNQNILTNICDDTDEFQDDIPLTKSKSEQGQHHHKNKKIMKQNAKSEEPSCTYCQKSKNQNIYNPGVGPQNIQQDQKQQENNEINQQQQEYKNCNKKNPASIVQTKDIEDISFSEIYQDDQSEIKSQNFPNNNNFLDHSPIYPITNNIYQNRR